MALIQVVKHGMNCFEKNNKRATKALFAATVTVLILPVQCFAQSYVSSTAPAIQMGYAPPYGNVTSATQAAAMAAQAQAANNRAAGGGSSTTTQAPFGAPSLNGSTNLGSASDTDSAAYKVEQVANQAQQERALDSGLAQTDLENPDGAVIAPPPDVESLQDVTRYQAKIGNTNALSDDPVMGKEMGLDIRKQAQKEAALSYGARGGLAKRNYQIMERMKGFETVLDRVFDFRALLIKAPSGLLIEPPIIKESRDAVVVTDSGDEAAVADKVFDINKKAKIVTAPRDWRQYLIQTWSQVPPPPRVLWPKNAKEQADWDTWVATGWKAGTDQADQIFDANVNQLTADYNGMVRYKMLLAQDMVSAPFVMHDDRGVAGNGTQMRVGDSAIKITGPSQFMTRADLWKPADQ